MVNKDFFQALIDLEAQKGINKEYFIDALETALTSAYKRNFGEAKSASVKLNPEKNSIKVYSYKTVVADAEVLDSDKEMGLTEARTHKKSHKVGDVVQQEESPKNFGRIAAQTAKQVVMQRIREAERSKMMTEVNEKQDELLTVSVRRTDGDNVFVDMGMIQIEGVLGPNDRIPGERYNAGDKIKVYVKQVRENNTSPHVQLTRANSQFVKKLFQLEVPEIASGEVEVKNIVREAGYRTKIAVTSTNPDIDAVGACVGNKGMRVNNIVNELNGEKIDIVPWSENIAEFIAAALSPATVLHVDVNLADKTSLAIVPDDKLSLAIGKSGQNVRLAARLTSWKIDVKAKSAVPSLNLEADIESETSLDNYENLFNDMDALGDL